MSLRISRRTPRDPRALDKLVASGRLTEAQATELRAAMTTGDLERTARPVQLQHASAALSAAVAAGKVSRAQADEYLMRLENGDDPHRVRRELRRAGLI